MRPLVEEVIWILLFANVSFLNLGTMSSSLAANNLDPVAGLHRLADWIKKKGLHRAAVTNAPRTSAEQMIAAVGLTDFFEYVVIGSECERAKPFPDPYLKGLEHFGVSAQNAFAFEVSRSLLSRPSCQDLENYVNTFECGFETTNTLENPLPKRCS